MNNTINYIFIFGLIFSLSISCHKENNDDILLEKNIPVIKEVNVLDNIKTVLNPIGITEYTQNPYDSDDEEINKKILEIAIATREFIKDNSINEVIMNNAQNSYNNCFNLNQLSNIDQLKSINIEYTNLVFLIENANLKHKSTNPFKSGVIEEYVPAIHIVNLETADMNKQPLICPGFEVNCDLQGMENFEDYIVAWFYDENDNLTEILLNEEMALNTTHPIFIIDNAEEELITKEKSIVTYSNSQKIKSTSLWTEIKTYEYQINHRYERSGNSEFCITAKLIDENGGVYNCINDGSDLWTEISEVGKNYIGDPLYKWQKICSHEVQPLGSNFIFWNTYERDWFNSSKTLGYGSKNGSTIYLSGNRRYSNEWYANTPGLLVPLDLTSIFNNYTKTYLNSKGKLQFQKYES